MLSVSRQIPDSPIEELPLEIAVIKWCHAESDPAPQDRHFWKKRVKRRKELRKILHLWQAQMWRLPLQQKLALGGLLVGELAG